MKHLVLDVLEFALNTCIKTFLIQGGQSCFQILATNSYEKVVEEVCDLIDREIVKEEFNAKFCSDLMKLYGHRPSLETYIRKLEDRFATLAKLRAEKDIILKKPL